MNRIKVFLQVIIIILASIIGFVITDLRFLIFTIPLSFVFFVIILFCLLLQLGRQKKYEEKAYRQLIHREAVDCCVVVVVKNEGDTIVNTIEHYLSFPEKLHILIYDDNSTDNSIERVKKLSTKFDNCIEIRKLVKRELFVHPKAFGTEDAFNRVKNDLFLVIDADTIITHSDFIKAVSALKNEKIDALHIARRNDKKNTLVNEMADKEELLNMAFHLTKFKHHQFGGSGYFVRREMIKGLEYQKGITSEDTYVLQYLRERGAKISFFFTLFAHERVPKDYLSMIKQGINWLNQSTPFFIRQFFLLLTFAHILFAFSFVGMLNPISVGFVFTSLCFSFILAIEIAIAVKILKQSVIKSIFYTLLLMLNMALVMWPIYIFLMIRNIMQGSYARIDKNQ